MPQPLNKTDLDARKNATTIVCKYCGVTIPLAENINHSRFFNSRSGTYTKRRMYIENPENNKNWYPYLETNFVECTTCFNTTIFSYLVTDKDESTRLSIKPSSSSIEYPDFVPDGPAQDYSEAVLIAELSPRASLTLSRRALQGLIRLKFPDIKQGNLFNEINSLDDKVPNPVKVALHALRDLGNIGAHPKDIAEQVTQEEAMHATKIIEFIIKKWYIEPHEDNEALEQIVSDSKRINPPSNSAE